MKKEHFFMRADTVHYLSIETCTEKNKIAYTKRFFSLNVSFLFISVTNVINVQHPSLFFSFLLLCWIEWNNFFFFHFYSFCIWCDCKMRMGYLRLDSNNNKCADCNKLYTMNFPRGKLSLCNKSVRWWSCVLFKEWARDESFACFTF